MPLIAMRPFSYFSFSQSNNLWSNKHLIQAQCVASFIQMKVSAVWSILTNYAYIWCTISCKQLSRVNDNICYQLTWGLNGILTFLRFSTLYWNTRLKEWPAYKLFSVLDNPSLILTEGNTTLPNIYIINVTPKCWTILQKSELHLQRVLKPYKVMSKPDNCLWIHF